MWRWCLFVFFQLDWGTSCPPSETESNGLTGGAKPPLTCLPWSPNAPKCEGSYPAAVKAPQQAGKRLDGYVRGERRQPVSMCDSALSNTLKAQNWCNRFWVVVVVMWDCPLLSGWWLTFQYVCTDTVGTQPDWLLSLISSLVNPLLVNLYS